MILKAAVIGVGTMGAHHARVYNELCDVDLVAVCDSSKKRAIEIGERWDVPWYTDSIEMLSTESPDIVSVAVPTVAHRNVVIAALNAQCHVLVEKPIALTVDQAREMIAEAKNANRILAVGHIERFNPAASEVKRLVDSGEIGDVYRISTKRVGPSPKRVRDVGVVIDLATHDIDVMRWVLGQEAWRLSASLRWRQHKALEDAVAAWIQFDGGSVGVLEADWLTSAKIRTITVVGDKGTIVADYQYRDVMLWRNVGSCKSVSVSTEEPLKIELANFVKAARGEFAHIVSAEDGMEALRLATAIIESGKHTETVYVKGDIDG